MRNREKMMRGFEMKRITRTVTTAFAVAALMFVGSEASAQNDAGSSAGLVLRLGSGSEIPAMGDAGVANATGVAALHYNPAGLGSTSRAGVGFMYQDLILDIGHGELKLVHPINSVSAWGVGVTYLDYGSTDRVTVSDVLNNNPTSGSFSGRDIIAGVSYGRKFGESLNLGLTAKVINSEIDNSSGTAVAGDVGLTFAPRAFPVRFGIAVQNFGSDLELENTGDDLPTLIRGGAAVDLFDDRLTLAADVEKVRSQDVTASVGAELRLIDILALRVGYDGRIDADDGLTAGLGVTVSDLSLDYAYIPFGNLGNNHRISLTYQWGPNYQE